LSIGYPKYLLSPAIPWYGKQNTENLRTQEKAWAKRPKSPNGGRNEPNPSLQPPINGFKMVFMVPKGIRTKLLLIHKELGPLAEKELILVILQVHCVENTP